VNVLITCLIAVVAVMNLLVWCCAAMAASADRQTSRCWRERAGWHGVETVPGEDANWPRYSG
jgi:hypothetical protein